jgi:hypothetical protein
MANSNVIKLDRESMEWRISTRRMEAERLWKRNNQLTNFYTPNNTIYDVYKRGYWKRDRWVVEGLFRAGSNVMIVGESNVGKTYIILDMLLNIVLGRKWFNMYKCDVGPTIYTGGEGNRLRRGPHHSAAPRGRQEPAPHQEDDQLPDDAKSNL